MSQRELPGTESEPAEQTIAGATFTSDNETMRVYEALFDQQMKLEVKVLPRNLSDKERDQRAKGAADRVVPSPNCEKKTNVCKNITTYIVYKGTQSAIFRPRASATLGNKRYFAMKICGPCGAWIDGDECGSSMDLGQRRFKLESLAGAAMTEKEKTEYRKIFDKAYNVAAKQRNTKQKAANSPGRYEPKKKKERSK